MNHFNQYKVRSSKLKGRKRIYYTSAIILVLSFNFFIISSKLDLPSIKKEEPKLYSKPLSSFVTVMEDWNRTWGGSNYDYGEDMAIDGNGDIYCLGNTFNNSKGQYNISLVKYNELGDQLWNKTWGGGAHGWAQAITADSLGNIYITGYTRSYGAGGEDVLLLKYNNSGSFQWFRTFGGSARDEGKRIALDSIGNIYILGITESFGSGGRDICLVKYNNSGNQEWYRTWGGTSAENAYALLIDSQNNIYLGGNTYIYRDTYDIFDLFLIKYNSSGNLLWTELLDVSERDSCRSLAFDSNEDIICGGNTDIRPGPQTFQQILILKYDKDGNQLWNNTWSSTNSVSSDTIALDSADNIYIGSISYRSHVVKFNKTGYYVWDLFWGVKKGNPNLENGIGAIKINSKDTMYIIGSEYSNFGNAWELSITKYRDALFAVSINSSHPENLFGNTPPQFNITFFEQDIDTTWYTLNEGKNFIFTGTTGLIDQNEWNFCREGLNMILFYANTSQGYTVFHGIRVIKDTLVPVIDILKPLPNQLFSNLTIEFELNITEANLISTWYNLNDGNNITIYGSNGTIDKVAWNHCELGMVKVTFFVSDIAENIISQEIYLNHTDDAVPPIININSPFESQFFNNSTPEFNVDIFDWHLDSMWYSLNNGANHTFTTNTTFNSIEWGNLPEGQITITFYSNDTLGYQASKTIHVYKDLNVPIIKVLSPTQSQLYGLTAPDFSVEISDLYLNTMWYTLDGGSKIIFTENETFNQIEWNKLTNGSITITFYANDSIGNLVSSSVKCLLDGYLPSITIYNPLENLIYRKNAPYYNISIIDENFDIKWYSINNGPKIFFDELTGFINQEAWEECGNGSVVIRFYANDTVGNLAFEEIIIHKDIIAPEITIISPQNNLLLGSSTINFNLSIDEKNFDSSWYCLNNGINTTFIGLTGTIDQDIWEAYGNGSIIIRFYANDTLGNLAFKEVLIRKDIISPAITINYPVQDSVFGQTAPYFDLLINEKNLDKIWYTIEHIVSEYPCSLNGYIEQTFWDLIADGEIHILFYANDTLGNIGSTSVYIIKDTTIPQISTPNNIPGYSMISILSALGIVSIIVIKRKIRK